MICKRPDRGPELLEIRDGEHARQLLGAGIKSFQIGMDLAVLYGPGAQVLAEGSPCVIGLVRFFGPILIAGFDGLQVTELKDVDGALWLLNTVRYTRADRARNVWRCCRCGYLQQFEADGPYENGWNVCPACEGKILRPEETKN